MKIPRSKTVDTIVAFIVILAVICGVISAVTLRITGQYAIDIVSSTSDGLASSEDTETAKINTIKSISETSLQYIDKYYTLGFAIGVASAALIVIALLVLVVSTGVMILRIRKEKKKADNEPLSGQETATPIEQVE